MSNLNDSLKDSYIGKVADSIHSYIAEITGKGFDPSDRVEQLSRAGELIENAGKARKAAEKALADAISTEKTLRSESYKLATDTVSLVEGLIGKNHELTLKLRSLRTDLIGNQRPSGAVPAPTPTPEKP